MKREEENEERENKQDQVVPVSERPKKVVPVFESEKRSCQYLIITPKVVPLYDVNPLNKHRNPKKCVIKAK